MDRNERELGKDGKAIAEAVSASPPRPQSLAPKVDELYRQGEALFAARHYEQAIHVWTRILFLERGDARVKSAIERAKRAVSERQREIDVELAVAGEALDRGDLEPAAERVRRALSIDPKNAEARQLAARVEACRRRASAPPTRTIPRAAENDFPSSKRGLLLRVSRSSSPQLRPRPSASPVKLAGFVLGVILLFATGALYLHLNWESIVSDAAFATANGVAPASATPVVGDVPGPSELHYYNGARLYEKGRYRDALAELSLVARDDVVFERARSLILRIEERLLRGGALSEASETSIQPER